MTRYLEYEWTKANITDVCKKQDSVGGRLLLNGNFADRANKSLSFVNQGFIRTASITSTDDLSEATITLQGIQFGRFVEWKGNGPNNTTIDCPGVLFDEITAVLSDRPITNVAIGTGLSGYVKPFGINQDCIFPNFSASVYPTNVEFNIYGCPLRTNGQTLLELAPFFFKIDGSPEEETLKVNTTLNQTLATSFVIVSIKSLPDPLGKAKTVFMQTFSR